MTKNASLCLAVVPFAVLAAVACGETQKPDPNTGGSSGTTVVAHPPDGPVPTAKPAAKLEAGDCQKLLDDAQSAMDAERIAVDKECKTDGDCMTVSAIACDFKCVSAAIPKNETKDWEDNLKVVNTGSCQKFVEGECGRHTLTNPATCKDGAKPFCQAGHCLLK
jgi:hypothetical protein